MNIHAITLDNSSSTDDSTTLGVSNESRRAFIPVAFVCSGILQFESSKLHLCRLNSLSTRPVHLRSMLSSICLDQKIESEDDERTSASQGTVHTVWNPHCGLALGS